MNRKTLLTILAVLASIIFLYAISVAHGQPERVTITNSFGSATVDSEQIALNLPHHDPTLQVLPRDVMALANRFDTEGRSGGWAYEDIDAFVLFTILEQGGLPELPSFGPELDSLVAEIASLEGLVAQAVTRIEQLEAAAETDQALIDSLTVERNTLQAQLATLQAEFDEAVAAAVTEATTQLQQQVTDLTAENEALEAQYAALQAEAEENAQIVEQAFGNLRSLRLNLEAVLGN